MRLENLIKKLPWESGRQAGGYSKLTLFATKKCDAYLLYYPQGSEIPVHTDPVADGRHYRLNIAFKKANDGGEFQCDDPILRTRRMALFRPDVSPHSVSKIKSGYRLMLSVGWIRN